MTDSEPGTAVDAFLARLARADQTEWDRASTALGTDLSAWEAAGSRARLLMLDLGLVVEAERLRKQAKSIAQKRGPRSRHTERSRRAIWAAQGAVLGLLAGQKLDEADIRCLCEPFADLIPGGAVHGIRLNAAVPSAKRSTGGDAATAGYCPIHHVPLTFGGCHVCRSQQNHRLNKFGGRH